jgi:hypothetical protein
MGNLRNSIAYFKQESVTGTAVVPASATDGFCSIEKPDVTTGEREVLESELLTGNIGYKKPQVGFETATTSVVTELRSHGDSSLPTEPDFGVLVKSAVGTPNISLVEAVGTSPAPSTTEFSIATEGNIKKFDFMLIDNATDGKVGRFCKSLKLAVIAGQNDKIDFNEGGLELNASLTSGSFIHGGSSVVGSIGEEIKSAMEAVGAGTITVTAVEQANGSYKYTIANSAGTFQLLIATGANTAKNFLKLNLGFGVLDLTGAVSYAAASACWGNRVVVNRAMTSAPTAADIVYPSVNYKPINEGHVHFTSGFYQSNSSIDGYLEQVIGCLVSSLGITIETGAIAKINFDISGLKGDRTALTASSFVPDYEDVQGFTGFCVEAAVDSTLVDANTFNLTVENEVTEKKSFKSCSGKIDSIVRSRKVSGTINPFSDGSTTFYDAIAALTDYEFSLVIGKKDADGFIVGKTVGIYLPQIMFSSDKTGDLDDNMTNDRAFTAHTGESGTKTEVILSFA